MRTYQWKKNFIATHSNGTTTTRGKLVFKTQNTNWIGTQEPVVVLVSPYSAFHEGVNGDLKMNAFLSTIKSNIQTPISVLIADTAHMETLRLKYAEQALEEAKKTAQELTERYRIYFEGCNLSYWHSSIHQDKHLPDVLAKLQALFENDPRFYELLLTDATGTYTEARGKEFPNKKLFVEKAIIDILDQCACLLVLAEQGYRFQFYPGASYLATEYANQTLLSKEKRIHWVHVFLSILGKSVNRTERDSNP